MTFRVLMDEVVKTAYGQLDLWFDEVDEEDDDGDLHKTFVGQVNGLVGAAVPGHVYVSLARYGGGSPVRIETHDEEPQLTEDWEDIVEVSTTVGPDGDCGWTNWGDMDSGEFELQAGPHRLRVSACGRDAGAGDGEEAEGPVDFYLIQTWPAPVMTDAIVAVGSQDARKCHEVFGSNR